VKINEVVQESVYDWFTNRKAAKLNAQSQTKDRDLTMAAPELLKKAVAFFRGSGPALTPQDQDTIAQIDQTRKNNNQPAIDWKTGTVKQPSGPSEFLKKFKVTDPDPTHPTVLYGSTEFQRDDAGTWIDFRTGKLAPPRFVRVLDKVSPPAKTSATPTHGGVTAIAVTDNAGVIWTKDEDNNRWLNDAGTVATPDNAAKLEKLAVTQYQARQMGA
jgi:hypothetical protein